MKEESRPRALGFASPWVQLIIGVVAMTMIANLQYGWTLFVAPLQQSFGWDRAAIQVAFTIFIVCETWLGPINGYLVDRWGPRPIVGVAGIMVGASWILNAGMTSLPMLYLAQTIGGVGAGAVYGACVGNALKWFPNRRGFAAGVTAAGFGMGSALTIIPISTVIHDHGFRAAFFYFGLAQGLVICVCAWLLRAPPEAVEVNAPTGETGRRQYTPRDMIKTPLFWLMYAMFVMMAAGGLMATAQLGPIARDFGLAESPVPLFGVTLPALPFALSIDRVLNGVTRPFFGWISDHIGRETTMVVAFTLEGLGIIALSQFGHSPVLFVVLTGLVFFAWGEIYSLFPATCGDAFGAKYASANAGLLYTAKGTAALLVPYSNVLTTMTGDWRLVFFIAAALNLVTAALAVGALAPMRRALARRNEATSGRPVDTPAPASR